MNNNIIPTLYLISGTLGDNRDISKNMILSLMKCHLIFVEEKNVFDDFVEENNIKIIGKVVEIGFNSSKYFKLVDYYFDNNMNIGIFESSGIPCFVDPGVDMLNYIYKLREKKDINIAYIPGGSALTAAITISGFDMDNGFCFGGFFSEKAKNIVKKSITPMIYFVRNTDFENLDKNLYFVKNINNRKMCIGINLCRNIPDQEFILRGTFGEIYDKFIIIFNNYIQNKIVPDVILIFDKKRK